MSFFAIFLGLNTFAALYLGVRVYSMFNGYLPPLLQNKFVFGVIVLFISQSYIIIRVIYRAIHEVPPSGLYYIASSALGLYALMLSVMIVFDVLILFFWGTKAFIPVYSYISKHTGQVAFLYLIIIVLLYTLGLVNSNISRITEYTVTVNKDVPDLRIVQLSDIHITSFSSVKGLEKMVEKINELDADIVVFTGDMIDGEQKPYIELGIPEIFRKINSRNGVFGVLGNHEYYGEGIDSALQLLTDSGIEMLRDNSAYLPELNMTLIGRDDLGAYRITGRQRASAKDLTQNLETQGVIVVLDHQPQRALDFANIADLQLSGHTHNGQIWPANFVVKAIYDNPWGVSTYGTLKLIVSCGYSTWGPPIRLGSHSEIVVINLKKQI